MNKIMKTINLKFQELVDSIPTTIKEETNLSFAIADKIDFLIKEKGLSKKEFAEAIGKRPCEVTRWLSGGHNFTLKTISLLSIFFETQIIGITNNA